MSEAEGIVGWLNLLGFLCPNVAWNFCNESQRGAFAFLLVLIGGMVVGSPLYSGELSKYFRRWATKSDLVILEKESKLFCLSQGSFVFFSHSTRPAYLVTVRDKTGAVRKAWVACGSWPWGILSLSREVRVVWLKGMEEDAPPASDQDSLS